MSDTVFWSGFPIDRVVMKHITDLENGLAELEARARLRTIEECAKIADRHDTGDCTREDMEARRIAKEIRGLGNA